jgi:hypothetical protein
MRLRLLACLGSGLLLAAAAARGEPVAAYMYSQNGVDGIPTLASQKPADVGTVFLKAADLAENGDVLPKLDSNGRFYPNAWTGTPRPSFTAMINAPPTFDWANQDPATSLTTALTTNSWQQDYNGGITVDAEFPGSTESFPANWQSTMTSLRTLANGQGQAFSLYVNPKYLSAARYPATATANAAALAAILGTPPEGVTNSALFPVYIGGGGNADQATLDAAAAAAAGQGFAYQWIFDITESQGTFIAGLSAADAAGTAASAGPAGYVAYSYLDTRPVTPDMTANVDALVEAAAVPEPGLPLTAAAALGSYLVSRRRPAGGPGASRSRGRLA